MTMPSTDTRQTYAGDGSTTVFTVPFAFFGPDELRVYQTTGAGVQTTLVRGTDYTVTGGSGASGSVIAVSAPASGITWSILRATTPTQQVALANAGPLPAATLERMVDRVTALAQEALAAHGRTMRIPPAEATDAVILPAAVDRANKLLGFDSAGQPTAVTLTSGSVTVSTPMATVLAASTVRGARTLLGVREHVDAVKDYGCDNTGVADCSAALQAAIDSMTTGVLYLRPGTYKLSADVTLKPNVMMLGDDPLLATLVAGAVNVKLLKYTASALTNAFTIRRVGFSNGGYSGVYAVHLDGTDATKRISLVSLEDLYISGGARGLNLRFCANSIIEKVRCNTSDIGMYVDTCTDTEINGGWAQAGTDFGIYIAGSGGAYDEGLRITSFSTNGQVKGCGISGQDWGQLTGCSFTTASGGPLAFVNAANWKVANCDFATGGGSPVTPGVVADVNCEAIQLLGNRLPINSYGIDLEGTKHVVVGNHLSANVSPDIRLRCSRSVVSGNLCDSTGSATAILEAGAADYNVIASNAVNGTVTIIGANSVSNGNNVVY